LFDRLKGAKDFSKIDLQSSSGKRGGH
jgi:hypothetical protein